MNLIDTNYPSSLGDFTPFKKLKTAHDQASSFQTEESLRKQYYNLTSGLNCVGTFMPIRISD